MWRILFLIDPLLRMFGLCVQANAKTEVIPSDDGLVHLLITGRGWRIGRAVRF